MPKDIREILKSDLKSSLKLSSDHREKFESKLQHFQKPKQHNYYFIKIAASIILLISLGYFFTQQEDMNLQTPEAKVVDLASVSPEMKKIENYYLTAINYEMASIEPNDENKVVLDTYLKKIAELTAEYKQLSIDLTEKEINERTVNALINNLQLRLQLLLDLKDTINEMNTSKTINNENITV